MITYRSYTNTPTEVRDSPLGTGVLHLDRLTSYTDAMTLNNTQRIVLDDKRDHMHKMLMEKKLKLETELLQHQGHSEAGSDPGFDRERNRAQEMLNELYMNFQDQLDYLRQRFQREWMDDPRNGGKFLMFANTSIHPLLRLLCCPDINKNTDFIDLNVYTFWVVERNMIIQISGKTSFASVCLCSGNKQLDFMCRM